MDLLPQPLDCRNFVTDLDFLLKEALPIRPVADRLAAEIPMLSHLAEIAGTDTLNDRQLEPFHVYSARDESVHQNAVDCGGRAMVVVVFGGICLDALRQGLKMLTHGLSDLLLQIAVFAARLRLDNGRLV